MNFLETTLKQSEYDFIKTNPLLGDNILFLTVGGSHGYGTNISTSDVDVRGVTLNTKSNLIGLSATEQVIDNKTDTTIYAFNKFISLIANCNPNTIEMLGCNEYSMVSPIGQELLDSKQMFLSQRAVHSFGGYAISQLRKLKNALAIDHATELEKEGHIQDSLENFLKTFELKYKQFNMHDFSFSVGASTKENMDNEVLCNIALENYPVRDLSSMMNELNSLARSYDKLGHRNRKKDDEHLNKHAMHLIRLYLMGIDILEKEEINTYRENDRTLLLSIRNGAYQNKDGSYRGEFFDLVDEYEKRFNYAKANTSLPKTANMKEIEEFVMSVNERVIKNAI